MAAEKPGEGNAGPAGPTVFVLFGATGDLANRMVLPAFYRLACEGLLPPQWVLVGNGRGDVAHEDFRARVRDALTASGTEPDPQEWDAFAQRVFFAGGGFTTDSPGSLLDAVGKARDRLSQKEERELAALPAEIESLEHEQAQLSERMSQPDYHRLGGELLRGDRKRLGELEEQLLQKFERWEALEEQRAKFQQLPRA